MESKCYVSRESYVHPLIAKLLEDGPVLTDGGLGTELQKLGISAGEIGDAWNLDRPERVAQVARSYVDAGSRIILTNTFRSNRIALASHPLMGKISELNRAGVEISRQAAANRAAVFASMGPSGKLLVAGEITAAELRAAFEEQAQALASAGADALILETMSDLEEAMIALQAARATGLPVVVSMVFDAGKNQDRTLTGVTPEQAARELTQNGADVVGANCGQGIEGFAAICRRLRSATQQPVWIKPNAGLPQLAGDQVIYNATPESFASHVPEIIAAGADFIGGCCGTDPGFIHALVLLMQNREGSLTT